MANKRNQAKKATKAARDAAFRASHAQQIEAIRSKATGQRPTTNQPSQKDTFPLDSRPPKQLEAPPGSAGKVSLDEGMPKGLLKTSSSAISTIQVSASSVQAMIAAPAAVSTAEASRPDTPRINTSKDMNDASHQESGTPDNPCAPTDFIAAKTGAGPPKRSFMRKLLVGAVGIPLGVATRVAASAATISAVAAALPACKTHTSIGMLGSIVSKALDLAVLPVSLVSATAA